MRGLSLTFFLLLLLGCAAPYAPAPAPDTPAPTANATDTPAPTAVATDTPAPTPTSAPIPITLYLPAADGEHLIEAEGAIGEDTAAAILDELVRREALPDVDFGRNPYFTVGDSFVKVKNRVRAPRVVARLDISDAFLRALEAMPAGRERVTLQCMANTFIAHYDAEVFMLTVEGSKLETPVRDYEKGISFDQYAKTLASE